MKKNLTKSILLTGAILLSGVFVAYLSPAQTIQAEELKTTQKHISVNGKGQLQIKPDVAYIQFGVVTEASTAVKASQENATAMEKVKSVFKDLNISDQDIKTVAFNTNPQYDYSNNKQKLIGYQVQHIVVVTYKDLNNVGKVLDKLFDAGINRVDNIRYGTEKMENYENQVIALALKNAKDKATTIAKEAGVQIKGVSVINEGDSGYQPPVFYESANYDGGYAMKSSASTNISSGTLKLEKSVFVVYEIQ